MQADLFLGNRNNLNALLLPVEAKDFQTELARLFGRNLLFFTICPRAFVAIAANKSMDSTHY